MRTIELGAAASPSPARGRQGTLERAGGDWALPLAVMLLAAALRLSGLDVQRYYDKADEGFYRRYAAALVEEPRSTLRGLVEAYLSHPRWQRFPSPLRAGHILLAASWMRLEGRSDFLALSCLSTAFSLATVVLAYAFARRLHGPGIALATCALMSASPLQLGLGRRALQDPVVAFFILAAVWAFYEACRAPSPGRRLALGAAAFCAVMCKESSVLLMAFFLPWLALVRPREGLKTLAALAVSLGLALACWLWLCGGPERFGRLVGIVVLGQGRNPYVLAYQSGSVFHYLLDFLLVSPLVVALVAGTALASGGFGDERAAYPAAFLAASYLAYSAFPKNLRYVLALDFPLRLLAALAVWRWTAARARPRAWRAAALAGLVLVDLFLYKRLFLDGDIYDPVTADLLKSWRELLSS